MYDLYKLGWHSFQQLCLTISREILGQTVESFLDTNDGGRDGAFTGIWDQYGSESIEGQFVIQCKFTSRKGYNLHVSDLSDEFEKAEHLVTQGLCDGYVLITNAGLSGTQAERIEARYKSSGVKHVLLLGSTWMHDQIKENKKLRMLVPRVYGLGDLSQILDERAYSQARALLDSMREDLSKIVITQTYRQAANALDKHGFVLLIGEPAAGKTTIASLLAMSAIDLWQASPLKLDDPGKVVEHWNPDEPSQLFWVDDAFGVTQYESHLVFRWNHTLMQIKAMIKKGARIVMTSRDYIYNHARRELKDSAFPLLRESQVVIDVHDLSIEEKQQILYNHLKMGEQPRSFRTKVKPFLEEVSAHARFIPETARRLADPIFTKGLNISSASLARYVNRQESFLQELIQGLDRDSKAGLALIYMRHDGLESPIQLEESETLAIERLGSSLGGCIASLGSLRGSLVQLTYASGDALWRFKHPTIGDAYAALLSENPELLGIFVQGSSIEKLIVQVTCGDVGYEKSVVLGKALFPLMLQRLDEFTATSKFKAQWRTVWSVKSRIHSFLSRRCSKEFLELYIEKHPDLLDQAAEPGLYLSATSELDVALRIHDFGLLPEKKRQKLVATVTEYAVQGEDLHALTDPELKSVFTETEYESLRGRVLDKLVPRLKEIREEWEFNYSNDDTPDEHMQPLLDSLEALESEYDDFEVKGTVGSEMQYIYEWITEQEDDEKVHRPRQSIGNIVASNEINSSRSVFDDIDT